LLHPIQLVPVSVAACVASALSAASLPATITVRSEGLESVPPVAAGQQSLVLVIVNLLQNAAEAMDGQGTIVIHAAPEGARVVLAVGDNGPGIPADLQERIFEFNFSARKAPKRGKLGFGLWWVKTLMARLGGSIQVESDGKTGTTFCLSLPSAENRR
jgi:signal transduction histidine kinase